MKKTLITASIVMLAAFAAALAGYFFTRIDALETIAIALGITAYNFVMRLVVGLAWNCALHNRVDYKRWWFGQRKFEPRLYKFLRVKRWKDFMPTFNREFFDLKKQTLAEVVGATCQAELVHETIIVLCFPPIALSSCFGAFWVFVITSVVSALLDSVFVIIQRYNRPRLVRLLERGGK